MTGCRISRGIAGIQRNRGGISFLRSGCGLRSATVNDFLDPLDHPIPTLASGEVVATITDSKGFMSSSPTRIGIVGVGSMGSQHSEYLSRGGVPDAVLTAV